MGRLVGCLSLLLPALVFAQAPCTYYASPNGGGDGRSPDSPFQIVQFWPVARPGTTLCLLDGTYRGSNSMLRPPSTFAGTASQPITIRALNDGKVLIDGGTSRPVDLQGSWGVLEGINVHGGDNIGVSFRGRNWVGRRIAAWNNITTPPQGAMTILGMSGMENTCEDCAAWGVGRKMLQLSQGGVRRNTVRRAWTRFEQCPPCASGSPTVSTEQGYDQHESLVENLLTTRGVVGRATAPEAPYVAFSTLRSTFLGSIAYVPAGARFEPSTLIDIWPTGGAHAGQTHTSNMVVRDVVGVIAPGHPRFNSVRGFEITGSGPLGAGSGNVATNVVAVSGLLGTCGGPGWTCTNTRTYASLSGRNIWQEVPGICKRYVEGTLTSDGLWPWPMNQRIKDALRQSGRAEVDITATIQSLLGTIPASCR